MDEFNAGRVLAEAYTLYKKHHDGMGLDFKIAIAQIRKEARAEGWDAFVDMLEDQRADWKKPVIEIYPNPFRADQIEGNE